MLTLTSQSKIFVYTEAADMRRGVNGLSGIVRSELRGDPVDGSLYVFINKRRDRLKILHFDGGGFWVYYRVLEAGTFESLARPQDAQCITMDSTELSMLLSGVSLSASQRRRKRFTMAIDLWGRFGGMGDCRNIGQVDLQRGELGGDGERPVC